MNAPFRKLTLENLSQPLLLSTPIVDGGIYTNNKHKKQHVLSEQEISVLFDKIKEKIELQAS